MLHMCCPHPLLSSEAQFCTCLPADGPKLPESAPEAAKRHLHAVLAKRRRLISLDDEVGKISGVITHELLLLASSTVEEYVSAPESGTWSGRDRLRLLAQLLAAMVGGSVDNDEQLTHKIGKRLAFQVSNVKAAMAGITAAAKVHRIQEYAMAGGSGVVDEDAMQSARLAAVDEVE